ncbi:MAG TPA: acyltransferase, partial [Burkholderiaceae bacterium]
MLNRTFSSEAPSPGETWTCAAFKRRRARIGRGRQYQPIRVAGASRLGRRSFKRGLHLRFDLGASPTYRRDIDGLRALAVLSVLVFHAFPSALPGGFVGVDIFFVISGYLINRILVGNLSRGRLGLGEFYIHRVKRILPALVVMLCASLAAGWVLLLQSEYKELGKHVAASASFIVNLVLIREAGYFDAASEAKPLLHLWSLAVEEQFYIVWPLLLAAAW